MTIQHKAPWTSIFRRTSLRFIAMQRPTERRSLELHRFTINWRTACCAVRTLGLTTSAPFCRSVLVNVSQNGMTGSDSRSWVMLRIGRQAVQSHKRMEPVDEKHKVCRSGCPCGDDCSGGGRAGRRVEIAGSHSESRRADSETG